MEGVWEETSPELQQNGLTFIFSCMKIPILVGKWTVFPSQKF